MTDDFIITINAHRNMSSAAFTENLPDALLTDLEPALEEFGTVHVHLTRMAVKSFFHDSIIRDFVISVASDVTAATIVALGVAFFRAYKNPNSRLRKALFKVQKAGYSDNWHMTLDLRFGYILELPGTNIGEMDDEIHNWLMEEVPSKLKTLPVSIKKATLVFIDGGCYLLLARESKPEYILTRNGEVKRLNTN